MMFNTIQHKVATLGFIGFMPYAQGTFGTAVSFLFILLLKPDDPFLLFIAALSFITGVVTSATAEKILGKDSGHIIIDEFCGYLIAVLFVPKTAGYLFAAFVLFRIFDILKPVPIKEIEETFSGGLGIMMDDLMAGIYANLCIQVWVYIL